MYCVLELVVKVSEVQSNSIENGEFKHSRSRNPLLLGTLMAILAFLAPYTLIISNREYGTIYSFSALIWHGTRISTGMFRWENFWDFFLPFLCLRLVSALGIANYYRGNSTRKRATLITLIGDGIYLPGSIVALITSLQFPDYLVIPLPVQMIVGLFILWRLPIPEPTRPWAEQKESGSWWNRSSKDIG